ncbi:hypothetical protein DMA15_13855 [Streptomyces sp. WAC 01529]|nr:hypothetical protein DMA15_13855 [Streptomyces sp. WAC 01529]
MSSGAVAVAWWQVRVAKHSTDAQTAQLRQQMAHVLEERDKADCPQFIMQETEARPGDGHGLEVIALIKQTSGALLREARVTVHLNHEPAHVVGAGEDGTLLWPHTGPTAEKRLTLRAPTGHRGPLEIRADLTCHEASGDRTWECRVFGYPHAEWEQILESMGSPPSPPSASRPSPPPSPPLPPLPLGATPSTRRALDEVTRRRAVFSPLDGIEAALPTLPGFSYPTLLHPEDIGLLAATPVLTRTVPGHEDGDHLHDDIW